MTSELTGIGATSLGVTRLRALENARSDRLVEDPYAELILAATGRDAGPVPPPSPGPDFFGATKAGCAQVVLLACGMDTRAFRPSWPIGTRVFEVDFAEVLSFRDAALPDHAAARCDRIGVAADLREDWTTPLRAAGFDTTEPTAWLAEGILYGLTAEASDALLARITELSAPGSTLAFDQVEDSPPLRAARAAVSAEHEDMWLGGPPDPTRRLTRHGRHADVRDLGEVANSYRRTIPAELTGDAPGASRAWLATGTRN